MMKWNVTGGSVVLSLLETLALSPEQSLVAGLLRRKNRRGRLWSSTL